MTSLNLPFQKTANRRVCSADAHFNLNANNPHQTCFNLWIYNRICSLINGIFAVLPLQLSNSGWCWLIVPNMQPDKWLCLLIALIKANSENDWSKWWLTNCLAFDWMDHVEILCGWLTHYVVAAADWGAAR